MDLFEEIVRMRRAGQRGALATIVHTNGSIPSYESSRMLVREDGSSLGTVGGGCVEADVWAAAREVMHKEAPRKLVFHLNNEATYDNGLICGGTVEIFIEPILPQPILYLFGGGHVSTAVAKAAQAVGFGDFLSGRPRVQAADVGIGLEPRNPTAHHPHWAGERERQEAFLKQLRGKTPLLNLQPYAEWMNARTHRKLLGSG